MINDVDDIKDLTPADTTKDYVYPTTGPDGKHIMVTVYDRTTQKNQIQLLSLDTPGEVTVSAFKTVIITLNSFKKMSADAFDSSHAFFDLFNYTVFSSTRYKNGNQLLFGIYTGGDPVGNPKYFRKFFHSKCFLQFIKHFKLKSRTNCILVTVSNTSSNLLIT